MTAPSDRTVAEATPNGLSRRSVVRVGAAAAWSVPVVALATSAPALAASGKSLAATLDAYSWNSDSSVLTLNGTVENLSDTYATEGLQLTLTIPRGSSLSRLRQAPQLRSVSGWTNGSQPSGNGPWIYVYTRVGQLNPSQTASFTITLGRYWLTGPFPSSARNVQLALTATAFTPGSDSLNIT